MDSYYIFRDMNEEYKDLGDCRFPENPERDDELYSLIKALDRILRECVSNILKRAYQQTLEDICRLTESVFELFCSQSSKY